MNEKFEEMAEEKEGDKSKKTTKNVHKLSLTETEDFNEKLKKRAGSVGLATDCSPGFGDSSERTGFRELSHCLSISRKLAVKEEGSER